VIGVLAIMAIVASFVAPSLIRQVQTATAAGEDAKLEDIAQALTNAIKATGFIPNPNLDPTTTNLSGGYGWAYLASNYTRLVGSNLISVFPGLTNDTRRRLYLSTNLAGTASNGGYNRTLSNWGATFFPTNAKMYLVSASRPDFNLRLPANGTNAQGDNNTNALPLVTALEGWIKVVSNGVVAAPANLVDGWTNKGEFLHVRTIDLAPIFNEARAAQQKISEQEDKNLEEIARALVASIQATGTIPDPAVSAGTGWVAQVAGYSSLGANAIQYSFPASSTAPGERRLYLDSSLASFIGPTPAGGWANIPAGPASAFLVSVSKEDANILELSTANGGTALSPTALNFLRTWQKTPNSNGVVVANNTEIVTAGWANRGEFLHVRPVDLRSHFCRVELEDLRCPATSTLTDAGSDYSGPITTNSSGVTLSLIADSSGELSSVSIVSPPGKNLWSVSGATNGSWTNSLQISGGGGTGGRVDIVFPAAPSYAAGLGAISPMASQMVVFYVFKGGSVKLSGDSFLVMQDVKYQFSYGTWRQVY
jgi:type II secretory pathway pseudopilin PulG